MPTASRTASRDACDVEGLWHTSPSIRCWNTRLNQNKRNTRSGRSRPGPRSSVPSPVLRTQASLCLGRSLHYTEPQLIGGDQDGEETDRRIYFCPPQESRGPQACRLHSGDSRIPIRGSLVEGSSGIYCPTPEIDSRTQGRPLGDCCPRSGVSRLMMNEFSRSRGGEDTDLQCVEVSALGAPASLPKASRERWTKSDGPRFGNSEEQIAEDFLAALLLKTDTYRPRQKSLVRMRNESFLHMRTAVVNWFASVCESYKFANETMLTAISNFDRYVAVRVEAVGDHMLLQLVAYVALLVASKMSETIPLRMKSLASLTGRMFTPIQVRRCEMDMLCKLQFRLAPPSADETLLCLSALVHNSWPPGILVKDVRSTGSYYLKKARARTCWFRHSPYTLAVAALATAYNSLGFGQLRRRLLRECDARARGVTGRGVDILGVAACAEAMARDERAAAAAAAAAAARVARGSTVSPSPMNNEAKVGWGSPTGVAQGAELLQEMAFSTVSTNPRALVTPSPPKSIGPYAVPKPARAAGVPVSTVGSSLPAASRALLAGCIYESQQQCGKKRRLPQSSGSCFEPCSRHARVDDVAGRFVGLETQARGEANRQEEGYQPRF